MKNVTISLPDDLHRFARVTAAEMDKSLSALVKEYLEKLRAEKMAAKADPSQEIMPSGITRAEFDRMAAREIELRKQIPEGFDPRDRLSREELYNTARRFV